MTVAQAFAQFDAGAMIDNALARVRRQAGIRTLAPTTSVKDFLNAQGLSSIAPRNASNVPASPANDSVSHAPYRGNIIGRRNDRRERRAMRALRG